MHEKPRNHPNRKPIRQAVMSEKLGVYWLFDQSFAPTALAPVIYGDRNGWPQKYPLVVAINFVLRTIEVGYAYEFPCDWPVGSASPDEIYLFARDIVRPYDEREEVSAAEWQTRLLKVLEAVNEDLQTAEINDAFKDKIRNYCRYYEHVNFHSRKGRFNLFRLVDRCEVAGYYICGPEGPMLKVWGADEVDSALFTLEALSQVGHVKQVKESKLD